MSIAKFRGVTFAVALLAALSLSVGSAIADSQLLTSNPGFESGITGWTQDKFGNNNAVFSNPAGHAGTAGAQVAITSYTDGDAKWSFNAIPVTAGDYLTFSNWYKSDATTNVFLYYVPTGGAIETPIIEFLAVVTPAADWTQLTRSFTATHTGTLVIAHVLQSTGTLTTDDYSVIKVDNPPTLSQGRVTLSFDDGWDTFYDNAYPVLNPAGTVSDTKATVYIISQANAEGSTDYMTNTQIETIESSGLIEIGAHSRNHLDLAKDNPVAFGYADRNAMWLAEINGSRTDLTTAGFAPVLTFAYPYGSYIDAANSIDVRPAVQAAGFTSARSVDQGYNDEATDKFALKQQHITPSTTVAEAQAWIDFAITNKVWVIMMFHDVRPTKAECVDRANPATPDLDCTDTATLQGIVNYLATKPAGTVVTMSEGLAALNAPTTHKITSSTDINGTITPLGEVSVVNAANQAFTFTPNAGFHLDTVTIDGVVVAATSPYTFTNVTADHTIAVTFAPDNASPVADAKNVSTNKNLPVSVTMTASDAESNPVTFATTSNPLHGTLVRTGDVLTYTPDGVFLGVDSFTYKANDGTTDSALATVSITVNDADAPVITEAKIGAVTETSVTITWTTDHLSTSRVVFGTSAVNNNEANAAGPANYGYPNSTTEDTAMVMSHSVTVSGLEKGTQYHFRGVSHGSPESYSPEVVVMTGGTLPVTPTPPTGGGGNSSGGGGGGGGGGNGPIAGSFGGGSLIPAFLPTPVPGTVLGTTTEATKFIFLNNLSKGMTHGDVMELQKRLVAEGFLTLPVPTTYFGNKTFDAVKAYQAKSNIESVGNVGPKTRAALNGAASVTAPGVPAVNEAAKQTLIDALKKQVTALMDKINAMLAEGKAPLLPSPIATSTAPVATTTPAVVSTSTPAVVSTSTAATSTQQ